MSPRTASLAAFFIAIGRTVASAATRFLRNEPRTAAEARVYDHLNNLVEDLVNRTLNRTFTPRALTVVPS